TYLYFNSISVIGMGKGSLIAYTYPIFAAIFTTMMGGEKMTVRKAIWVAVAFAGMVLLLGDKIGENGFAVSKAEALGLLGALLSGMAVAFVKKLHETDSTYAIFFAQCMGGFWIMILPATYAGGANGITAGAMLVGVGLLAAAGQLTMTESYKTLPVTSGSLLTMLTPVFSTLIGVIALGELVTMQTIVGGLIVMGACVAILLGDRAPT
ncbi:MAG: DMT family transporter, partial [Fibrobacteres bacterium]|nr:DMT family transporter [Fibrobacterota bacterium]